MRSCAAVDNTGFGGSAEFVSPTTGFTKQTLLFLQKGRVFVFCKTNALHGKSEVGGCPNREILMGLACVIPSLGLWTSISAAAAVPLGFGVFDFVAK